MEKSFKRFCHYLYFISFLAKRKAKKRKDYGKKGESKEGGDMDAFLDKVEVKLLLCVIFYKGYIQLKQLKRLYTIQFFLLLKKLFILAVFFGLPPFHVH